MESGEQANSYIGGTFTDWNSSEREIIDRTDCSLQEIRVKRTAVDACGTVRRLNHKYTEDHKPDYVDWEERIWALIRIGILPKDAVKYMNKRG